MRYILLASILLTVGLVTPMEPVYGTSEISNFEQLSEELVHYQINTFRGEYELNPLTRDNRLDNIAREYACAIADGNLDANHEGMDSRVNRVRSTFRNLRQYGENTAITNNYVDPETAVVGGWINSDRHREVITNQGYRLTGIGTCTRKHNNVAWFYYVQIFVELED